MGLLAVLSYASLCTSVSESRSVTVSAVSARFSPGTAEAAFHSMMPAMRAKSAKRQPSAFAWSARPMVGARHAVVRATRCGADDKRRGDSGRRGGAD